MKEIVDWSCGDRSLVDHSLVKEEILSGHSVVTRSLLSGRLILWLRENYLVHPLEWRERYTRVKKLFVDIQRRHSPAHSLVREIYSGSFSSEGDILWLIL